MIVGLFLMWRRLNNLEERVFELTRAIGRGGACPAGACPLTGGWVQDEADEAAEDDAEDEGDDADEAADDEDPVNEADAALMRAIFEQAMPGATFMMFSDADEPAAPKYDAPKVEEIVADAASEPGTEHGTETTTATGAPSKTQLRKLPVDTLKEMLAAKGLSTDGNKNALVQRLVEVIF